MRNLLFISVFALLLISCKESNRVETIVLPAAIDTIAVNSSIRALQVINDSTVFYAGSNAKFGYTLNNSKTWHHDSIIFDTLKPEFRGIAHTSKAVFVLSVASPTLLFKTKDFGKNWELVYRETDSLAFYNSIKFLNDTHGIAVGDPINGCLSVIETFDGGNNWHKISCSELPKTVEGEAGFAASNTNISVSGQSIWLVSGGKKARVFYRKNNSSKWEVYNTPIMQGGSMTGIFSSHFYNDSLGVIFGGNWEKKDCNFNNKAITYTAGKTWVLLADSLQPGYTSCVQFSPQNQNLIVTTSTEGTYISSNQGKDWELLSKQGFYTLRFSHNDKLLWLAGKNKIAWIDFQ